MILFCNTKTILIHISLTHFLNFFFLVCRLLPAIEHVPVYTRTRKVWCVLMLCVVVLGYVYTGQADSHQPSIFFELARYGYKLRDSRGTNAINIVRFQKP